MALENLFTEEDNNYKNLSLPQLILKTASPWQDKYEANGTPRLKEEDLEGLLKETIKRRVEATGTPPTNTGTVQETVTKILNIEGRFEEFYEHKKFFKNQWEQLREIIKLVENNIPNYFERKNLAEKFGKQAADIIRANYEDTNKYTPEQLHKLLKTDKECKTNPSGFAQIAYEQKVQLRLYELRKEKSKANTKRKLPQFIIIKDGKTAESLSEKMALYIADQIPHHPEKKLEKLNAEYTISHYYKTKKENQAEKATLHPVGCEIFTTEIINALEKNKEEYEQLQKNKKIINKARTERQKKKTLNKLERTLKKTEEEYLQTISETTQRINKSIEQLSKEEQEDYLSAITLDLGEIHDLRGFKFIYDDDTNMNTYLLGQRAKRQKNYLQGSLEIHDETDEERHTNYTAVHAKFKSGADIFEGHFLKGFEDWLGRDNNSLYHMNKRQQKYGHFNQRQDSISHQIEEKLLWIAKPLEDSFKNTYEKLASPFNEETPEELIKKEAKNIHKQLYK